MHFTQGCGSEILALLPSIRFYLPSRIASRFSVALLLTAFTLPSRSAPRLWFLHMCWYCLAIADDVQVLALCVCLKGILVEDARGIYHSPSCDKSLVGSERTS